MRDGFRLTSPLFFPIASILVAIALSNTAVATPPDVKVRDPRVMEAAKMYEVYFLNQMMKAMRATVSFSDASKPSMGESIYRDNLDDQYVQSWAEQGGIGLAELIHDEMQGKLEARRQRADRLRQPKGVIPLTDRDTLARARPKVQEATKPTSKIGEVEP